MTPELFRPSLQQYNPGVRAEYVPFLLVGTCPDTATAAAQRQHGKTRSLQAARSEFVLDLTDHS